MLHYVMGAISAAAHLFRRPRFVDEADYKSRLRAGRDPESEGVGFIIEGSRYVRTVELSVGDCIHVGGGGGGPSYSYHVMPTVYDTKVARTRAQHGCNRTHGRTSVKASDEGKFADFNRETGAASGAVEAEAARLSDPRMRDYNIKRALSLTRKAPKRDAPSSDDDDDDAPPAPRNAPAQAPKRKRDAQAPKWKRDAPSSDDDDDAPPAPRDAPAQAPKRKRDAPSSSDDTPMLPEAHRRLETRTNKLRAQRENLEAKHEKALESLERRRQAGRVKAQRESQAAMLYEEKLQKDTVAKRRAASVEREAAKANRIEADAYNPAEDTSFHATKGRESVRRMYGSPAPSRPPRNDAPHDGNPPRGRADWIPDFDLEENTGADADENDGE